MNDLLLNTRKDFLLRIAGLPLLLAISGCIHLNFDSVVPLRASGLSFKPPTSPFVLFKDAEADKSWQSEITGNIISFISNCAQNADKPLSLAINDLKKSFDHLEGSDQKVISYNGREATEVTVRGRIDGIKVALEAILFNKNKCFYQITYSGVSTQTEKERPIFKGFKENFKAP